MWSKLLTMGSKFLQKAAPKLMAAGEKIMPKVMAAGEKVMGKLPGVVTKAQEGMAKTWGKVGSKLAAPTTKSTIEGVGKGIAKGFGKVGSWMASHPLGTVKLAGAGFVGLEANKFLTNTTGKGLVENVGDAAKAIDNVASGKQAGMVTQTAEQAGPAGIVGGILNTVSNVFGTVSNAVGGLVGNKDMGGVLTALGVGAAGLFGLKRVGILAPLAIAGAGLFAANQAGLFKGAQQGSPIASQNNADLSKIAFTAGAGTGLGANAYQASTGVSGLQGNSVASDALVEKRIDPSISSILQSTQNEHMSRAQAESGLTDVERARLGTARDTIARAELLSMDTSDYTKKTPEQIAADAAKRELKAWEMSGLDSKMPLAYSVELKVMSGELTGKSDPLDKARTGGFSGRFNGRSPFDVDSRSKSPLFGSDNPAAMSASGKSSLDMAQMMSGAGLASGAVAGAAGLAGAAASGLESKSATKSEPFVTVEADVDETSTQKPDLGPEQLA